MRFSAIKELTSLPYFKLQNGYPFLRKSVLAHEVVDMHTHLGWHYLFTGPLHLWKQPPTRHFFPQDIPFDLSHYTSLDFTDTAKHACRRELLRPAFDTRGYASTHTIPNLFAEMDRLQVTQATVLAIDLPVLSRNSGEYLSAVNRSPVSKKRISVFVSLHPYQRSKEAVLQSFLKKGAKGIKLHPQMQLFRPTDRRAFPIYDLAGKYRVPVLFHTGLAPIAPTWQRYFVQRSDYENIFREFPRTTFIIGHSGGMDGYEWAAKMANTYPNLFVETSGQPPRGIAYLINKMDEDRILYGSDWPFYPMVLPFAKTLLATEKRKKIRIKIFLKNAEKLFTP